MRLHLVLPGLIANSAQQSAPRLVMPALAALCARGKLAWQPAQAPERWLAQAFGLDPARAPYAALRANGDGLDAGAAEWLAADPAHLMFFHEHLVLSHAPDLSADDAQALLAALNAEFADLGHFEYGAPARWYLRLAQRADLACATRSEAASRRASRSLPEGRDGPAWRRAMNEIQMLLFDHPVNRAREERGQPAVNTVWFWGAGALDTPVRAPAAAVLALDPLAQGLARRAGAHCAAPPDGAQALDLSRDSLLWLDQLALPAETNDQNAWTEALAKIERDWLAPALAMLQRGKIHHLQLTCLGDGGTLALHTDRMASLKLWRKYSGSLPPTAPAAE
ncbi:MAG: hypothetical protein JNM98_13075 [Rhodocyclaceae bacterium]|nr:hypothetical protein [Rhodocyclaceae bacterium]